jgi:hypothetical protein
VADIKKTTSVKPSLFSKSIGEYAIHAQMAYYIDLIGASSAFIIAVEEAPPHETRLFQFTPASIDRGRAMYEGWLDRLAGCLKSDRYPGVDEDNEDVTMISEPEWAQRNY